MIKFKLLILCVLCTLSAVAQISYPERLTFSFDSGNENYIQNWNPTSNPDDHWFVSQVPLKERFVFTASQANPALSNEKQYLLWAIASKYPRGNDEIGWAINQMEYRDMYCLWVGGGGKLELPPASRVESCHRQGVKVTANITFADGVTPNHPRWVDWLGMFEKDANGKFIHAQKIAEICKHYGLDGLSLNWEVNNMSSNAIKIEDGKEWCRQVRQCAANIGMSDFELVFYYVWYNNGVRSFGIGEISSSTDAYFGNQNDIVTTAPFLNYDWTFDDIDVTVNRCNQINRDSKDVFFGVTFYGNKWRPFGQLAHKDVSIGCWGEPYKTVNLPKNTTLEKEIYFNKQAEMYMSGPNNDPTNVPAINANDYGYTPAQWGLAAFRPAKSAIKSIPWHTNFCTGNGEGFYFEGKKVHSKYWNNESIQSDLPTWKWWWQTGGSGLTSYLDYYAAYTGATSIKIKGNVSSADNILRLFKTKLLVDGTTKFHVTYKVDDNNAGVASHLELALAFEEGNNLGAFVSLPVGNTTKAGWNTAEIDLSAHAGKTIAVVGVNITGQATDLNLNLGGMSITNDAVETPPAPINIASSLVNQSGGKLYAKVTWGLPNNPRYNEDSGVDHFEIYQVNGDTNEKSLVALSRARGIILNDIPALANNNNLQFEVVSVANDNIKKSTDTTVTPPTPDEITLATGTVMANDNWQTITLDDNFTSMVVVATPVYSSLSETPGVVRIKNVTTNSFDIKLQSGNTTAITTARKVYYLAVEEGIYTEADHGIKMEAVKASTSATSFKWNWNVEARQYNNSYTDPVIVGQVMTENDTDFSHFWISSGTQSPITASSFNAGLLVDEHQDTSRASETIGYVVFESGTGSLNNRKYVAQNASGITSLESTSAGHTVNLPSNSLSGELYGFATINGMTGSNGGWANLYTADGLSTSAIKLALDEDQFGDSERKHIGEKVCYLVIDNPNAVAQKSALVKDVSNDELTQRELKLYPNPTSGILNVSGVKQNSIYEIYNITGAKIRQGIIGSSSINIEDIAKGIYWIRIIEGTKAHTRKIVKH